MIGGSVSIEAWTGVGSFLLAVFGLMGAWWGWRSKEFRREEVVQWGLEAVGCMQTIELLSQKLRANHGDDDAAMRAQAIQLSVLIEQGRLFFRNTVEDDHGAEKEPAYRGYRPVILDQLVIGFEVATHYPGAPISDREKIASVMVKARGRFVSLLQQEVGRARVRSYDAARKGKGVHLPTLLALEHAQIKQGGAFRAQESRGFRVRARRLYFGFGRYLFGC